MNISPWVYTEAGPEAADRLRWGMEYVGWEQIAYFAARNQGQALIDALRRAAAEAGGGKLQDDFSLALLQDKHTENRPEIA